MLESINSNRRNDAYLNEYSAISNENLKRGADILAPLFNMYSERTALIAAISGAGCQVYSLYDKGEHTKIGLLATALAATILFPTVGYAASHAHKMYVDFSENNYLQLAHGALYVTSVATGFSHLIVASLLVQALTELQEAFVAFNDEKHPEALAKVAAALLRITAAYATLQPKAPVVTEGKKLTQEEFDALYDKFANKHLDLEAYLKRNGYSNELEGLNFSNIDFVKVSFNNLIFTECRFQDSYFFNTVFRNIVFNKCSFAGSIFERVSFENVTANDTSFADTELIDWNVIYSTFSRCNFSWADIENYKGGKIAHTTFSQCNFHEMWLTNAYFSHVTFEKNRNFNQKRYIGDELNTFEDVKFN